MTNYETADFYTDIGLLDDPHSYFDYLRGKGSVSRLPGRNAVAVTGYDETVQVMLDPVNFSSITAVNGAMSHLPFQPEGDDIEAQLEASRAKIDYADQIATENGQRHTNLRSLVTSLFTPSRLKALEPKLYSTADLLIDEFIADGRVLLPKQYGSPYATLIIGYLLGIPDDARQEFREMMEASGAADFEDQQAGEQENPLVGMGKKIFFMVGRRRLLNTGPLGALRGLFGKSDAEDILTQLSLAKFPDGTTPKLSDLAALGAFLFAAGGDTTNLLLANSFKLLALRPDIQDKLREYPSLIPSFVEEILRYDGSVKCAGRICQKTTTLGGMEIKAGTHVLLSHMAANRDPERFSDPGEFRLDRPKAKEHLAFGRGPHTCPGSPLARREITISIERLLARMKNFRLSPEHHGIDGNYRFEYDENFTLRVLKGPYLEFDQA